MGTCDDAGVTYYPPPPPRRGPNPGRILAWIVLAVLGVCVLCVCGQWIFFGGWALFDSAR